MVTFPTLHAISAPAELLALQLDVARLTMRANAQDVLIGQLRYELAIVCSELKEDHARKDGVAFLTSAMINLQDK